MVYSLALDSSYVERSWSLEMSRSIMHAAKMELEDMPFKLMRKQGPVEKGDVVEWFARLHPLELLQI